jgi:hypothetical protein
LPWIVKQLGPQRQQIQLELLGDGILGIIYEATPDKIIPLRTRLTGPGGAFIALKFQVLLWGGFWLVVRLIYLLMKKYRRQFLSVSQL